jgi:hypothetical protein
VTTDDVAAKALSDVVNCWRRWATWPLGFLRAGGEGRGSVPFPEPPREGAGERARGPEEVHARRFLDFLQHLTRISGANSKILHALGTLWVTPVTALAAGARSPEAVRGRRNEALADLLAGYQTLSREWIEIGARLLAALLNAGR